MKKVFMLIAATVLLSQSQVFAHGHKSPKIWHNEGNGGSYLDTAFVKDSSGAILHTVVTYHQIILFKNLHQVDDTVYKVRHPKMYGGGTVTTTVTKGTILLNEIINIVENDPDAVKYATLTLAYSWRDGKPDNEWRCDMIGW